MRADGSTPTLLFLHVGKTAGATVRRVLRRQYPRAKVRELRAPSAEPGRLRRESAVAHFAQLPEAERARPRLILGHFTFGLHEHVPRQSTYVTLLREPTALVLSQYQHVRRHEGHLLHEEAKAYPTIDSYIRSGVSLEMDNSQTRAFAGDTTTPFGACTPAMLDLAKEHLERSFAVVGLTERFDESLLLMRRAFGWRDVRYVALNVDPYRDRRDEPTEEALALIRRHNALDLDLYRWALDRFDRKVAAVPGFPAELDGFRLANRAYQPWGRLLETPGRVAARLARRV